MNDLCSNLSQAAELDDILSRWHHWSSTRPSSRGYAPKSLVCGDYKVSRQYDDSNGALDSDLESATMKTVDFQVSEMADPYRSCIHALARSLCCGYAVWSSPRVPAEQRKEVEAKARVLIVARLIGAGVM
jgi:hypothetical protein